jgi:hypothetical protein
MRDILDVPTREIDLPVTALSVVVDVIVTLSVRVVVVTAGV